MPIVIFRSRLRSGRQAEFQSLADEMMELARAMPGFVSYDLFTQPSGERCSLIEFDSDKHLADWREHPRHKQAQARGRERFYAWYSLQVGEQTRTSSWTSPEGHIPMVQAHSPPFHPQLSPFDANYIESNRVFIGGSDTGEFLERRDVAIANSGIAAERLNVGFLKPPDEEIALTIEFVRKYFTDRQLPFNISLPSEVERDCAAALAAAGFRPRDEPPTPVMTLAIPDTFPARPEALTIEEVRSSESLKAFRECAFEGFGFPVAGAHIFLNERNLSKQGIRCYAGRVAGEVISTSILLPGDGIAGIYWVSTAEAHRGLGYGEALTWAAVEGGKNQGCHTANLQASQVGAPVYRRMGFSEISPYVAYLPED